MTAGAVAVLMQIILDSLEITYNNVGSQFHNNINVGKNGSTYRKID